MNLDLTDLFSKTAPVDKTEALDLLGDLLDPTQTSLFGDKPIKISKPRPKWHIDGLVVVQKVCTCLTCGTEHVDVNPLILLSESLVDHEGRVLKSVKSANPESLKLKDEVTWGELTVTNDTHRLDPIAFCNNCQASGGDLKAVILTAFENQRKEQLRKEACEDVVQAAVRVKADRERALQAERRLFEIIDQYEKPSEDIAKGEFDLPSDSSFDPDLPY